MISAADHPAFRGSVPDLPAAFDLWHTPSGQSTSGSQRDPNNPREIQLFIDSASLHKWRPEEASINPCASLLGRFGSLIGRFNSLFDRFRELDSQVADPTKIWLSEPLVFGPKSPFLPLFSRPPGKLTESCRGRCRPGPAPSSGRGRGEASRAALPEVLHPARP